MNLKERFRRIEHALAEGNDSVFQELSELLELPSSVELSVRLLGLLHDEEDAHHEMFAIIHALERQEPMHVYEAVSAYLPQLNKAAREWSEVVVCRLLMARREFTGTFDAEAFLDVVCVSGSRDACGALAEILRRVEAKNMDLSRLPTSFSKAREMLRSRGL